MRLLPWMFTFVWVPVAWAGYWVASPGGEKTMNYLVAMVVTWGASTWALWKTGVLGRIYGGAVVQPKRCPKCGLLEVPGVDHSRCGKP